jgi:hypothetical protein
VRVCDEHYDDRAREGGTHVVKSSTHTIASLETTIASMRRHKEGHGRLMWMRSLTNMP